MGRNLEIERKFLVKTSPPGWKRHRSEHILQGYFPMRGRQAEIRLRHRGSKYLITAKGGRGLRRTEVEIQITKSQFTALWPLTTAGRIAKRRYQIPFARYTIEMDVYEGPHHGLITADIEFNSIRQSRAFKPPVWFGREITGSKIYGNQALAIRGRLPPKRKPK